MIIFQPTANDGGIEALKPQPSQAMNGMNKDKTAKETEKERREARLARQLRENLKKRKIQMRERAQQQYPHGEEDEA